MKFVVYGTEVCPFCVKAKDEIEQNGYEYSFVNLDTDEVLREWFKSEGYRTVPQVYLIEEDFTGDSMFPIGGYSDLIEFFESL